MSLSRYEEEFRKANARRVKQTELIIKRNFEIMLHDIISSIGAMYANYEVVGTLTYEEMAKYNRLQRLEKRIMHLVGGMSVKNRQDIYRLLRGSYEHSYQWMSWAIEKESLAKLRYSSIPLSKIDEIIDKPIGGRTLKGRLKHWDYVTVDNLFRSITQDLVQGSTYRTMAQNTKRIISTNYEDTIRIVRTESHRIQEHATLASAESATAQGVIMLKKWNSMHDGKVRNTGKASHVDMDGQEVRADEEFELMPDGGKGAAPGNTGYAAHDINCRCFATYRIVAVEKKQHKELADLTFEEWKKERER